MQGGSRMPFDYFRYQRIDDPDRIEFSGIPKHLAESMECSQMPKCVHRRAGSRSVNFTLWSLEIWHSFRWTISTKTGVHTRTCWLSAQFLQFSIEIQLGFSWIQSADWISEDAESLSFGFLSSLVAQLERARSMNSPNEFSQQIFSTNSPGSFNESSLP